MPFGRRTSEDNPIRGEEFGSVGRGKVKGDFPGCVLCRPAAIHKLEPPAVGRDQLPSRTSDEEFSLVNGYKQSPPFICDFRKRIRAVKNGAVSYLSTGVNYCKTLRLLRPIPFRR